MANLLCVWLAPSCPGHTKYVFTRTRGLYISVATTNIFISQLDAHDFHTHQSLQKMDHNSRPPKFDPCSIRNHRAQGDMCSCENRTVSEEFKDYESRRISVQATGSNAGMAEDFKILLGKDATDTVVVASWLHAISKVSGVQLRMKIALARCKVQGIKDEAARIGSVGVFDNEVWKNFVEYCMETIASLGDPWLKEMKRDITNPEVKGPDERVITLWQRLTTGNEAFTYVQGLLTPETSQLNETQRSELFMDAFLDSISDAWKDRIETACKSSGTDMTCAYIRKMALTYEKTEMRKRKSKRSTRKRSVVVEDSSEDDDNEHIIAACVARLASSYRINGRPDMPPIASGQAQSAFQRPMQQGPVETYMSGGQPNEPKRANGLGQGALRMPLQQEPLSAFAPVPESVTQCMQEHRRIIQEQQQEISRLTAAQSDANDRRQGTRYEPYRRAKENHGNARDRPYSRPREDRNRSHNSGDKPGLASCWSCGSSSHMRHDCPRKSRGFNQDDRHRWGSQPSSGRRGGQRQGACFKCGGSGHWASNCRSTSHNSEQVANQQDPLPSWAVPPTRNNPTPHLQFQFPPAQFVAPTNMAQQPSIAVQQRPVLHQQLHPGPPPAPPPPPPGTQAPVMASQ